MYSEILNQPVPQTQPLNERQVMNNAGGFSYAVDQWDQLDRFLILGTLGGTYYLTQKDLTNQNFEPVLACVTADGTRVVRRVVEISQSGRAVKNDPAIFVLALVFKAGDDNARKAASEVVPLVCRTGTHLMRFAAEITGLERGWGRALKRGVGSWFTTKSSDQLAHQAIKYPQREGWSLRDLLRLSKPKMGANPVAGYITHGTGGHPMIDAALSLKGLNGRDAARVIADHRLPREAIPTELLNEQVVWEALLKDMPLTALVRNLGKMSSIGLIAAGTDAELQTVALLSDKDRLRKARVHPLSLLVAMAVYGKGSGVKGSLTWTVSDAVLKALSEAVELAMDTVEPMGLKTLVAIDVSGSMHVNVGGSPLKTHQAAACMAIAGITNEPMCHTVAFSSKGHLNGDKGYCGLQVKGRRLDDVVKTLSELSGGTDLSLPLVAALDHPKPFDLIQIYTDSETWAGHQHMDVALAEYRTKRNPKVKVVVAAMTANRLSVGDPGDPAILQCIGFDASLPQVISAFAGGKTVAGSSEEGQ